MTSSQNEPPDLTVQDSGIEILPRTVFGFSFFFFFLIHWVHLMPVSFILVFSEHCATSSSLKFPALLFPYLISSAGDKISEMDGSSRMSTEGHDWTPGWIPFSKCANCHHIALVGNVSRPLSLLSRVLIVFFRRIGINAEKVSCVGLFLVVRHA